MHLGVTHLHQLRKVVRRPLGEHVLVVRQVGHPGPRPAAGRPQHPEDLEQLIDLLRARGSTDAPSGGAGIRRARLLGVPGSRPGTVRAGPGTGPTESPWNRGFWLIISAKMQPMDQMSTGVE